ncbi:MAG TPA: malate synthase G, partial [Tabrizicola sp.]|nr:malate synthase G [Tabrizicola sp.]
MTRDTRHGLQVDTLLRSFIEDQALPGTGIDADQFWAGFADIVLDLTPVNKALLDRRSVLQDKIDAWHLARRGQPHDHEAY